MSTQKLATLTLCIVALWASTTVQAANLRNGGWIAGKWGACSKTCGGGTQQRSVTFCGRRSTSSTLPGFVFLEEMKSANGCQAQKPSSTQTCNTHPCPVVPKPPHVAPKPRCSRQKLKFPKLKGSYFHANVPANEACKHLGFKGQWKNKAPKIKEGRIMKKINGKWERIFFKDGKHKGYVGRDRKCKIAKRGGACYWSTSQNVIKNLFCEKC